MPFLRRLRPAVVLIATALGLADASCSDGSQASNSVDGGQSPRSEPNEGTPSLDGIATGPAGSATSTHAPPRSTTVSSAGSTNDPGASGTATDETDSSPGGAPNASGTSSGTGGDAPQVTPPDGSGATPGGGGGATGRAGDGGDGTGNSGGRDVGTSNLGGSDTSGGGDAGQTEDAGAAGGSSGCAAASDYDALVLCDDPVGFWTLEATTDSEPDLSGRGNDGSYRGGTPATSMLPNGDAAADFDGETQYLTIPSDAVYSIPTTGTLTWEAWIQPAVLQFPNDSGGYVDWMGKCAEYSPTCEWEARLYNTENDQDRCNRLSAYVFNPGAGLGSGADFQPECGLFQARDWFHVVGQYTLLAAPDDCQDTDQYPGSIEIWVNGVKWNHARHGQTGCMSQYDVIPEPNDSPVNVGTMAGDAWFQGAIGKLAIYDRLLGDDQIKAHFRAMTGQDPTGSCDDTCTF